MSAASPKDVVRQYLDYLGTGNTEGLISLLTDDVVFDFNGLDDLPWAGRWEGIEKIHEYFEVMFGALEIRSHVIKHWISEGDKVVVLGDEVAASRKSGKEYEAKWSWTFTVRGDKIAVWDAYEDTEKMAVCGPYR